MVICRMHGEPLVEDFAWYAFRCPSQQVCGTWVSHEVLARADHR